MSDIGNRIKQRRMEKGLALAELARRVNISKGYLHNIENGTTQSPSAEILFRIAVELNTTIADLLSEVEPESPVLIDIPLSLSQFADEADLTEDDVQMLARVEYRGRRPTSVEDWRYIFESIKRTLR